MRSRRAMSDFMTSNKTAILESAREGVQEEIGVIESGHAGS